MRKLGTNMLPALTMLVLVSAAETRLTAQEPAEARACAQLLPAIESLKLMLAQDAKARASEHETQRIQLVATLLGLRYRNVESLESSLRAVESEEDDARSSAARIQAQLEALDEETRNAATLASDPVRKAQRADIDANLKGLEEKTRGLRARKSNYQATLAMERSDIGKLEALVRAWLEKSP